MMNNVENNVINSVVVFTKSPFDIPETGKIALEIKSPFYNIIKHIKFQVLFINFLLNIAKF